MKNLFSSKTLLVACAFAFTTYLSPAIERSLASGEWTQKETNDAATGVAVIIAQAVLRYAAVDVTYTSKGLPGRNKPEEVSESTDIFY